MSPSLIKSGAGRVDGKAGEIPRDGRDLNGARTMQALPSEGMEGRRVAVPDQLLTLGTGESNSEPVTLS